MKPVDPVYENKSVWCDISISKVFTIIQTTDCDTF